jgi:WD40 repeat protein
MDCTTASSSRSVITWNLATGEKAGTIWCRKGICDITWSHNSIYIVGNCDNDISIWNIFTGDLVVEPGLVAELVLSKKTKLAGFYIEMSGILISIYLRNQRNELHLLAECKAPDKLSLSRVNCGDCICAAAISPDWSPDDPQYTLSKVQDEVCCSPHSEFHVHRFKDKENVWFFF